MNPAKNDRLRHILEVWNTGDVSLREVGMKFDMPRDSVARLLYHARKRGFTVLTFSHREASQRQRIFKGDTWHTPTRAASWQPKE